MNIPGRESASRGSQTEEEHNQSVTPPSGSPVLPTKKERKQAKADFAAMLNEMVGADLPGGILLKDLLQEPLDEDTLESGKYSSDTIQKINDWKKFYFESDSKPARQSTGFQSERRLMGELLEDFKRLIKDETCQNIFDIRTSSIERLSQNLVINEERARYIKACVAARAGVDIYNF